MDHEFEVTLIMCFPNEYREIMKCKKCGWWTIDMGVASDHLIVVFKAIDDIYGNVQVAYTCEEWMIKRIQNG